MYCFQADDGRILTPPNELKLLLKSAFPAFCKLLGHIRWFYMADEIWDGKSSLAFNADGEQLAALTLDDCAFHVHIVGEDFQIIEESALDAVFEALKKTASSNHCRPFEQRTVSECPCGRRCDLCLGSKEYREDGFSPAENFGYMNWVCYHGCIDVAVERFDGVFKCPGCESRRDSDCACFICLAGKGFANCAECGEYRTCDAIRDCHHPAQCNIGMTVEEVTKLVIPYAQKERLDTAREAIL